MKTRLVLSTILLLVLASAFLGWRWLQGQERRDSAEAIGKLSQALQSGDAGVLLEVVVVPQTLAQRTFAEQSEFLTKALRDEVSAEGLAVLKRKGTFGPLKELFPAEGETWAQRAGVDPNDCVAFKMERNGLRAEAVLVKPPPPSPGPSTAPRLYRIVRVNNVKQMADTNLLTTENTQ